MKTIWPTAPIETLCSRVTSGGTPSRANPDFYKNGTIPWIKTGELNDWYIDSTSEKITDEAIRSSSAKIFPPETVLLAMYGDGKTMGTVGLTRFPSASNQACCAMIVDPARSTPKFLLYSLIYNRPAILKLTVAGAQRNLNGTTIKRFEIGVPPLKTQRRIASILSAYDDLIENNTRRIAILEEMARRIYEEWFVHFRFPGHEQVKMVESELGLIPEGWEVLRMGDYCDVTDYVANGSFAALKENVTYCDEPNYAILVRTKDYGAAWGGIFVYVTEESYRFLKKSKLSAGDIVVGNVGNAGMTFRVPDLGKPMTLGPNAITVRPKSNKSYVYEYLCSNIGQHLMRGIVSGAAQPKFNKTEFRKLFLPLPPEELLIKYEGVADSLWQLKENLRRKNANLRTTRDLLLPKLISGELDVSNITAPEEAIAA